MYDAYNRRMTTASQRLAETVRREATNLLDPSRRSALGQFMTPQPIADFMASLFRHWPGEIRLLDPGAGIGSLTDAFSERFLKQSPSGSSLEVDCYEIEPQLTTYLRAHLEDIRIRLTGGAHAFDARVHQRDFIEEAAFHVPMGGQRYTHAILNPPYKKISSSSAHRKLLRAAGIETVNLYTAFLGLAIALMKTGGEIVAIIPRSFCNGTYFRSFRRFLLERTALTHIHVFESRSRAFKDDDVLQENIIIRLVCGEPQGEVVISHSHDAHFGDYHESAAAFSQVVKPDDVEQFIHVPMELPSDRNAALFTHSLDDLQIEVSTGPVVDFRVREFWLQQPDIGCVPLLYTHHFRSGRLEWPKEHKKPNALRLCDDTRKWLLPKGCYTITKRFSAKEERRRLVAYVVDPDAFAHEYYGFENHVNVFHASKRGLPSDLARGLATFLNSTLADEYFRSFSGHTQVNATDLRAMRYPSPEILQKLCGLNLGSHQDDQAAIDAAIETCLP